MAVSTTITPANQPPRPSTTGYRDRSDALALRPKLPRLRIRRHINSSEMSASSGRPTIAPATPLASAVCRTSGLKSIVRCV